MVSEAFAASVQAVATAPQDPSHPHRNLLAVGLEDGSLHIFQFIASLGEAGVHVCGWQLLWKASAYQEHCAAILKLAWQRSGAQDPDKLLLASAGQDHAVQIYEVNL